MRLSDYTQEPVPLPEASQVQPQERDLGEQRAQIRALLYEEISSERIAQLSSLERGRARIELSALIEQLINEHDISIATIDERVQLVDETLDMVLGFGPIENMLADPSITEIMVNGTDSIFIEREGELQRREERFASEEQLRLVVDRIVSPLGRRIDEQQPIVNARLPQGHRVNAVIPPISLKGTTVTIRKFREVSFTLSELVENGTMSQAMAQLLVWAVLLRENIAVSGGTGGGKTTLLNALSREIPHAERIVTIEDSAELRFDHHPHVVQLEARMANTEGRGCVTIRDLVTNALRMRPDRIIVGECRGAEALDMLQAMLTGHDGSLTTLHANSPAEVVPRLVMMVRYGIDLPTSIIEMQIASALDLVVQQDRTSGGKRRITQICARRVRGPSGEHIEQGTFTPCVSWDRRSGTYEWHGVPCWVDELAYLGIADHEEVRAWLQGLQ